LIRYSFAAPRAKKRVTSNHSLRGKEEKDFSSAGMSKDVEMDLSTQFGGGRKRLPIPPSFS